MKFGIANLPTLFGTADGRELQLMAERFRWPLPPRYWSICAQISEVLGLRDRDPTNADLGRAHAPPGEMGRKTSALRGLAKGFKGRLSGLVALGAGPRQPADRGPRERG